MTLIATHISRFGVIHGSDSSVTRPGGFREASPIFRIGNLAAVSVAGSWAVGEETDTASGVVEPIRMDQWMPEFITAIGPNFTLMEFAQRLRDAWQEQRTDRQRRTPSWAHICGCERSGEQFHTEFWAVSNVLEQNPGTPIRVDSNFHVWEDFSRRDCRDPVDLIAAFMNGSNTHHSYVNGFPEARMTYNALQRFTANFETIIQQFMAELPVEVFDLAHLNARTPLRDQLPELPGLIDNVLRNPLVTREDHEQYVQASVRVIIELFRGQQPPVVGGAPLVEPVWYPDNMIQTADRSPIYHL